MRTRSLSTRLLASVSVLLLLFFGVTIFALDFVFTNASLNAIRTRLEVHVFGLISASDEKPSGKLLPGESLAEARFNNPGSGLYGQIARSDGKGPTEILWTSSSMTGVSLDLSGRLEPGKRVFRQFRLADGSDVLALSLGFQWEFANRRNRAFVFSVAENLEPFNAELQSFRKQLFAWFGGLMLLLLGALAVLFRWVLQPVRKVEREIEAIEAGRLAEFGSGYPRELVGITTNMNALLRSEHERLARYRNTLGNLAHSLKTPLAVIRNLITTPELRAVENARQLDTQVERMDDIVRYQLKRAAMSGGTSLGNAPIQVSAALEPLRAALRKVYTNKDLSIEFSIDARAYFSGDQGDLMEIAGNLLDN
ncbi:MAG: hypothetical protein H7Y02_05015, partial [Candidatus Obscuribacterales bacterium]|nr:hypothetical protein [Steroidobacteraceae bacterium]